MQAAVKKILPLIETSGEPVFKNRGCVSCHNNSLPAMTVALARRKGFAVNEEQAKKELGFAVDHGYALSGTDAPGLDHRRRLRHARLHADGDGGCGLSGRCLDRRPYSLLFELSIGGRLVANHQLPASGGVRAVHYHRGGPASDQAVPDPGPARGIPGPRRTRQALAALGQGFLPGRTIDATQRTGRRGRQLPRNARHLSRH